ncbi:hypothetical protein H2199_004008 [Coniosporium tulheliwenetii]|uniref:Uncharacterized protein n=1 Tax=Coniosporium tulheliwenetii TaxID=3383036 RepID=A0ACC2Z9V4_9PEZI|nr:hypothetical protein H2199_004008 [Cladosporium sp. JES 115]
MGTDLKKVMPVVYQYQPLRDESSIRLLKLKPSGGSELICELLEVSITNPPKYEALSYAWGSGQATSSIQCSGKPLSVSASCAAALHRLRQRFSSRLLWIDQICINQPDAVEKSHQLVLMGEIYSKAQAVVIWLGERTDESDRALQHLRELEALTPPPQTYLRAREKGTAYQQGYLFGRERGLRAKLEAFHDGRALDLLHMFTRSWFTRTWTLQEIALARQATVLCGKETIDWGALCHVMAVMADIRYHQTQSFLDSMAVGRLALCKNLKNLVNGLIRTVPAWGDENPQPILTYILRSVRMKEVTKHEDKIYALYGLTQALNMNDFPPPAVGEPVEQIYSEATRFAISHDQSLAILYQVEGSSGNYALPSWVPDLSQQRNLPSPLWHQHFHAAKSSKPRFSFPSMTQLCVQGKRTDMVVVIGLSTSSVDRPDDVAGGLHTSSGHSSSGHIAMALEPYPNGEPALQAFAKTIVQNAACGPMSAELNPRVSSAKASVSGSDTTVRSQDLPARLLDHFAIWHPIIMADDPVMGQGIESLEAMLDVNTMPPHFRREYFEQEKFRAISHTPAWKMTAAANLKAERFHFMAYLNSVNRVFFTTAAGYMGLGPKSMQPGDFVALFSGMALPAAVRAENGFYRLLGPVYIQGIMDGELWCEEEANLEDILIV